MHTRTKQHPGVEHFEVDMSQYTDSTNRVTAVVAGFSHQGRSDRVIDNISDTKTLVDYFGEPRTDAEKYFYYGCKKVLDNNGALKAVRIPYSYEREGVVPAYKYAVLEGSVDTFKGNKAYIPTLDTSDQVIANMENLGMRTKSEMSGYVTVTDSTTFPDHCVVSSIGPFDAPSAQIDLKNVWGSAGSARFVTLCDAKSMTDGKCDANEDTRFVTVTNVEEVAVSWIDLLLSDEEKVEDLRVTQKAAIVAALATYGMTLSGDITWSDDSVVETSEETFVEFGGKKYAEGKFLTDGYRDGIYVASAKFKIDSNATFVANKDGKEVKSSTLAYELRHATAETSASFNTTFDDYVRVLDSDLKNAKVFIASVVDTTSSANKGIEGLFGKGVAPEAFKDISRIVEISRLDDEGFVDAVAVDEIRNGNMSKIEQVVGSKKGFVIVNSTNRVLDTDTFNNDGEEVLGIVPFVFTGFNALPVSRLIDVDGTDGNTSIYQCVNAMECGSSTKNAANILNMNGFNKSISTIGSFSVDADTIANDVVETFPKLVAKEGGKLPGDEMNYTAILVAELKVDPNYGNKIVVTPKELFYGTFDNKSQTYLPDVVNANSNYIELYTNYEPAQEYRKDLDKMLTVVMPNKVIAAGTTNDFWFLNRTACGVLGYRSNMLSKRIRYSDIEKTLARIKGILANVDQYDIDFIEDAGLSTIAQFVLRAQGGVDGVYGTKFDSSDYDVPTIMKGGDISSSGSVSTWKSVADKLIEFSEVVRKDCYTVIDGPRNLTIDYNAKIVQMNGTNTVADYSNRLKYLAGFNTTYACGITNWVRIADEFTGRLIWLPPSIFKVGASIAAQNSYGYPWYVATGTERGKLNDAVDISITLDENAQDVTYSNNWNYLRQFSDAGIVIWGQKNLTSTGTTKSMMDRENVRRMFLYGERLSRKAMKKHLFKPITTARLENVTDDLNPIWSDIKDSEGAYEFKILCNSRNNTPDTIMRNELRATVAVKPTALSEYIILGFISVGLNITITEDMMANV